MSDEKKHEVLRFMGLPTDMLYVIHIVIPTVSIPFAH